MLFRSAMCAAQIEATIKADPTRRRDLLTLFPLFNPASIRTSTVRFDKCRENALRAGSVFLAMIQQTATGSRPIFEGKEIEPTLDYLVALKWADVCQAGDSEARFEDKIHSIEHREVRSRYPVAHVCAALAFLAKRGAVEGRIAQYDYRDFAFLREWVALAQDVADILRRAPNCEPIAAAVIDVRWIE